MPESQKSVPEDVKAVCARHGEYAMRQYIREIFASGEIKDEKRGVGRPPIDIPPNIQAKALTEYWKNWAKASLAVATEYINTKKRNDFDTIDSIDKFYAAYKTKNLSEKPQKWAIKRFLRLTCCHKIARNTTIYFLDEKHPEINKLIDRIYRKLLRPIASDKIFFNTYYMNEFAAFISASGWPSKKEIADRVEDIKSTINYRLFRLAEVEQNEVINALTLLWKWVDKSAFEPVKGKDLEGIFMGLMAFLGLKCPPECSSFLNRDAGKEPLP